MGRLMAATRLKKISATRLKVLADDTRLHVMRELMRGEQTVGELNRALRIEQSLLSHHLKILRDAGLVLTRRAGKCIRYRLTPEAGSSASEQAINLGCCKLSFAAAR